MYSSIVTGLAQAFDRVVGGVLSGPDQRRALQSLESFPPPSRGSRSSSAGRGDSPGQARRQGPRQDLRLGSLIASLLSSPAQIRLRAPERVPERRLSDTFAGAREMKVPSVLGPPPSSFSEDEPGFRDLAGGCVSRSSSPRSIFLRPHSLSRRDKEAIRAAPRSDRCLAWAAGIVYAALLQSRARRRAAVLISSEDELPLGKVHLRRCERAVRLARREGRVDPVDIHTGLPQRKGARPGAPDLPLIRTNRGLLKQVLKQFNIEFEARFGREPSREDKEILRPLYLEYKQLKAFLPSGDEEDAGQPGQPGDPSHPAHLAYSAQSARSAQSSQPAQPAQPSRQQQEALGRRGQSAGSVGSGGSGGWYSRPGSRTDSRLDSRSDQFADQHHEHRAERRTGQPRVPPRQGQQGYQSRKGGERDEAEGAGGAYGASKEAPGSSGTAAAPAAELGLVAKITHAQACVEAARSFLKAIVPSDQRQLKQFKKEVQRCLVDLKDGYEDAHAAVNAYRMRYGQCPPNLSTQWSQSCVDVYHLLYSAYEKVKSRLT